MSDELRPDFTSTVVERGVLPGSDAEKVMSKFTDPLLSGYSAVILADSLSVGGEQTKHEKFPDDRLLSMVVRFPRCILSEINTHRVFSRNSASSRARALSTTVREIMEDPYIPLFTRNQRGMHGRYVSSAHRKHATEQWLQARDHAVAGTLNMLLYDGGPESVVDAGSIRDRWEEWVDLYYQKYKSDDPTVLSVHKQNSNRLLEPFMWHEAIISSTYWGNFFDLRDHEEAQPEIRAIARLMRVAAESSVPQSSWVHAPFSEEAYAQSSAEGSEKFPVDTVEDFWKSYRDVFMDSAGDCARVSYASKLETGSTASRKLGERLLSAGHMSPFEHVAVPAALLSHIGVEGYSSDNFSEKWVQFRTLIGGEILNRK